MGTSFPYELSPQRGDGGEPWPASSCPSFRPTGGWSKARQPFGQVVHRLLPGSVELELRVGRLQDR
jgi:hypothetical protein